MSSDSCIVPKTIAVIGGGSFGTVLANIAASNGHRVTQWMRNEQQALEMTQSRFNKRYLPECRLADGLVFTASLEQALRDAEVVFVSIPSSVFRTVVQTAKQYFKPGMALVSTTKGIEAGSFKSMSQVLADEAPECRIGVLSGPNLAKEIGRKQLSATVIASEDASLCCEIQKILHCAYFRVYAGTDLYGVELGGALKNIYAIAAGMSSAMEMGENTRSMLMTRSLAEMSRFAVSQGADPMTFLGLAGVGDLIVTCMSPLSRNFRVGFALGKGRSLDDVVEELGEVAEGVNTIRYVKERADQLGVSMPLVNGLYRVVFQHEAVSEVVRCLMEREQGEDVEFVTKPVG